MKTTVHSFSLDGERAIPVTVETEVLPGIGIHLVGLHNAIIREVLTSALTALRSCGYSLPGKKIIINVSPGQRAAASQLDLPIAIGILTATAQLECPLLNDTIVAAELGLDGSIRSIDGGLAAGELALQSAKDVLLPPAAAAECAALGIANYCANTLPTAIQVLQHKGEQHLYENYAHNEEKP